jgi:hypothetical protein
MHTSRVEGFPLNSAGCKFIHGKLNKSSTSKKCGYEFMIFLLTARENGKVYNTIIEGDLECMEIYPHIPGKRIKVGSIHGIISLIEDCYQDSTPLLSITCQISASLQRGNLRDCAAVRRIQ